MKFEKGCAYMANDTISGEKAVVACTGRRSGRVTFSRVGMLKCVGIREIEGRETALIKSNTGRDLFVSAACTVDLQNAAEVLSILERSKAAW